MADWQSLQSLADAVDRGEILGFFSTRAPWLTLPDKWADDSRVVKISVPQGFFVAKEEFLGAMGYQTELAFYQDASQNNLKPATLPLAVACGPYRQRLLGAAFLTAASNIEPYVVVANAEAERPLLTEALQRIFPGVTVQTSIAAPTLRVFSLVPPDLRRRFDGADPLQRRAVIELIVATTSACLLIVVIMLLGLPGWISLFTLLIPYVVFSRAKYRLDMKKNDDG